MDYVSTRGAAPVLDFKGVTLAGLAPDGGLYVPRGWPRFTPEQIAALAGLPYAQLAQRVMQPFVGLGTIALSGGAMPSGLSSCTIVVAVRSATAATYNNLPANVTGVSAGMTNNATATLTVNSGVALSVVKTVRVVCDPFTFAGNGVTITPKAIPGAYMQYTITITNGPAAVNSATLTTIGDALDPFLNFDSDLRTGSVTTCASSPPESAVGKGFVLQCSGGTRTSCSSPVYFTSAADTDPMAISGSSITLTFGDAPSVPKALPTEAGYTAGELKPGESVTIRFNTIVK